MGDVIYGRISNKIIIDQVHYLLSGIKFFRYAKLENICQNMLNKSGLNLVEFNRNLIYKNSRIPA